MSEKCPGESAKEFDARQRVGERVEEAGIATGRNPVKK